MQFSFVCYMFMHSHAYVLSFQYIFIYLNCFGTFLSVSFFLPHSLVYISASWHQNINLLHDEQARKYFLENFSRRGVHLECQVIFLDFSDIDLPTIIHNQG